MTMTNSAKLSTAKSASFAALQSLVAKDMTAVNTVILKHMQSDVALIPQVAGHLIQAGGKRLRPILTLAAAKLCGYQGSAHIDLAAVVEFIHTATLLHDDVVDASILRRGLSTANAVWDNKSSILVGDFLFSRAFELMTAVGDITVLRILSQASAVIAEGEVLQMTTTKNLSTTVEDYWQVITAKTAKLFAAATEVGAVIAKRPSAEQKNLEQFGLLFGIAYQLTDDILDYTAITQTLGKNVGDDFRESKISLPVILAYQRSDKQDKDFFRRTFVEGKQTPDDFARLLNIFERTEALNDASKKAQTVASDAVACLKIFPDSPMKTALIETVEFCVNRNY